MLGIFVIVALKEGGEFGKALLEGLEILQFGLGPLNLSQCRHTRQCLILYKTLGKQILCPQISLGTEDMLLGSD